MWYRRGKFKSFLEIKVMIAVIVAILIPLASLGWISYKESYRAIEERLSETAQQSLVAFKRNDTTGWTIVGSIEKKELLHEINDIRKFTLLMLFIGILLALLISHLLIKIIKTEKKTRELAYYDILTQLPNRITFEKELADFITQAEKEKSQFALVYLDLDNFKNINDTLGHVYGDQILIHVSHLLKKYILHKDTLYRLGGDEFAIVLSDMEKLQNTIHNIIDGFKTPIIVNDHSFYITSSIGIAVYPRDGQDVQTLLKNADAAMYHTKSEGKNGCYFYDPQMNQKAHERLAMEDDLRKALTRKEFQLYYQPQFDLQTKKLIGMEALIRWRHPVLGFIPPNEFISVAEESGLIIPIGTWVLEQAIRDYITLKTEMKRSFFVAVNLSTQQFQYKNLVEIIKRVLERYNMDPQELELEITESAVIKDLVKTTEILKVLRNTGIKIALDDFGTGYSSLNYLKKLPIDTLKIDKSFVENLTENEIDKSIVKATIDMSHAMDLKVVAEGVETVEQMEQLQKYQCDIGQGYLFAKPMPLDEMKNILTKSNGYHV